LDYNLNREEIVAYERLVVFKSHIKLACKLIIEDIHRNFDAYKVSPSQPKGSSGGARPTTAAAAL
jgi:hypothetical protein